MADFINGLMFQSYSEDELFQMFNRTDMRMIHKRGGMAQSAERIFHMMGERIQSPPVADEGGKRFKEQRLPENRNGFFGGFGGVDLLSE